MKLKFKEEALYILKCLNDNGYEAYIVGGAVRNALLGIPISDYDITTSALPEEMENIFNFAKIIPTGLKHGTLTIFYNHIPFEITTYRIDGSYFDNRHPENVTFTNNLKVDLSRRDFTINAMCYNNDLVDMFNGLDDLNNKIIRTVNNPICRFEEDALRILRAIRFSCQLNFTIEDKTKYAIHLKKELLKNVSSERIMSEILKTFSYNNDYILNDFFDVFKFLFPFLESNEEIIRKFKYLDNYENKEMLKLAYIFKYDNLKNNLYDKYKLSNRQIWFIKFLNRDIDINDNIIDCKYILKNYELNDIISYTNYHIEEEDLRNKIKDAFNNASKKCHRISMLKINGKDLYNLPISKNEYAKVLNNILDLVIQEKLDNNYYDIMNYLKNTL